MNTDYIEPFFDKFIVSWIDRLKHYYDASTYAITNKGHIPINAILTEEERIEICDEQKNEDFELLNDVEKEVYLNSFDKIFREKMNLIEESNFPSSLSFLSEQNTSVLEIQKMYLINQLVEIETIISIKRKMKNNSSPKKASFIQDDVDEELLS